MERNEPLLFSEAKSLKHKEEDTELNKWSGAKDLRKERG